MFQIKFILSILVTVILTTVSCKKDEASFTENLTAAWISTSVKINGIAASSSTTMKLHLQTGQKFEITTNIAPFTHPTSGAWSADEANNKLTLAGNIWTIHHLEGNTLRLTKMVDLKELEIDFNK